MSDKVYCGDCRNYTYAGHHCSAVKGYKEIPGKHYYSAQTQPIYRCPPEDNTNNDCPDHKTISIYRRLWRSFVSADYVDMG